MVLPSDELCLQGDPRKAVLCLFKPREEILWLRQCSPASPQESFPTEEQCNISSGEHLRSQVTGHSSLLGLSGQSPLYSNTLFLHTPKGVELYPGSDFLLLLPSMKVMNLYLFQINTRKATRITHPKSFFYDNSIITYYSNFNIVICLHI